MEIKGVHIKIDSELYKRVKIELAKRDITLKQYITELIERDLKNSK